jgi:hypothetical protein
MTDWRKKPRTGKSQFFPLMPEIQSRLKLGETYTQIHNDLREKKQLEISYQQFAKYIKAYIYKEKTAGAAADTSISKTPLKHTTSFGFAAGSQEKRRDDDLTFHNPVPDKEKIYGPAKE